MAQLSAPLRSPHAFTQSVMRVFLQDKTMKTLPVTFPSSVQFLLDAMKKKQPLVDTSNYAIFEYKNDNGLLLHFFLSNGLFFPSSPAFLVVAAVVVEQSCVSWKSQ